MKLATKAIRPARRRARRRARAGVAALDDHADPIGECGGVLEVVRDEERRQAELDAAARAARRARRPSCARRAPRAARRAAARRDRAQAPGRVPRADARRPRGRPARASARCAIRSRSSSSSTRSDDARRSRTFGGTLMCGNSAYSWNTSPTRAPLRRQVDAARGVEPRLAVERDRAALGTEQAGDRPQHGRLAGARRARRARASPRASLEAQLEGGTREGDGEMLEVSERHRRRSLTEEEQGSADDDEHGADRERGVEVDVELLVDRERERLGHALQRAREHDRRAELAEPARKRQSGTGAEPAGGERERDAGERPCRALRRGCARRRAASGRPPRTPRSPCGRRTGRRRRRRRARRQSA